MSDVRTIKNGATKEEPRLFYLLEGTGPLHIHYETEEQRLRTNLGLLKQTLNPCQKKLLLRIVDDKNLVCERAAQDWYEKGFCTATRILIESLYLR